MDAEWLKEHVGEALSQAMVDVARNKPLDPVEFLGKHLLHYVEYHEREIENMQMCQRVAKTEEATAEKAKQEEKAEQAAKDAEDARMQSLEKALADTETPCQVTFSNSKHGEESDIGVADDLAVLEKDKIVTTTDIVKEYTSAHSVYIGKRNGDGSIAIVASTDPELVGVKLTNELDDEGESKVLPFSVFEKLPEEEEEEEEEEDEEGNPIPKPEKVPPLPKFVHVENMLKDDRVPFFDRVPTLGSFLAVNVPFSCAMHSDAIPEDGGLLTAEKEEEEQEQEATEATDENAGEKPVKVTPKEWRANTIDGAYVICFDTMGKEKFVSGIPESEIELVRSLAQRLGRALSGTEALQYQSEMGLRDELKTIAKENRQIFALEMGEVEETIKQAVDEYNTSLEEAEAAAEEKEEAEYEAPMEEEVEFKRAEIRFNVLKERVGSASWWHKGMISSKKLCIEPDVVVQKACTLFLRIYGQLARDDFEVPWGQVKRANFRELIKSVVGFAPVGEPCKENCQLDSEHATKYLDDVEAFEAELDEEEDPAWIFGILRITIAALKATVANYELNNAIAAKKAAEIEAAEAAAAEAAEAAAAAEAEAAEEETE
mmetsp:Transcript_20610/g.33557  ORF Transcript_20610/g.33557 Transcript_20610/m.33557 type:complete len:602 (-) Transcript_20610:2790-4595(-)